MKMDRSGRTLKDYRKLFWEAEKTIEISNAKLTAVEKILKQFDASEIDDVDALCQISAALK